MQLAAYLDRIGVREPTRPDLPTLRALHRAHLLAIPYENLDIHLGRRLSLDVPRIFDKLVGERRGGWCFEMNGLFAWALREVGFDVRLLAGTVNRALRGDAAHGNHLVMCVQLDGPYLADVGFGNGFLEPLPLGEGRYRQGHLSYSLAREGERWQFDNHEQGGAGYDFTLAPHRLADFAGQCDELQTAPTSSFVRTAVCHRFTPDGIVSLRGAVLSIAGAAGATTHTVTGADEYVALLEEQFGLCLPQAAALWPEVWRRHQEWIDQQAQGAAGAS
jgi:N-hydroxyarylamine O-acetyltransferase